MNIFFEEHKIVLKTLINHQVDFMLVGGYAVIYHGYNRVTGDMDIWLKPDNDNKLKLIKSLTALGFDDAGIKTIQTWDFTTPQLFYIGKVPERTDFMNFISGVEYNDAASTAIHTKIDNLTLTIIHINSLIINKESSGRTKDRADAEYLRQILKLERK